MDKTGKIQAVKMKTEEYLKLSEVTEKKFPIGMHLSMFEAGQVDDLLNQKIPSIGKTASELKKKLIYGNGENSQTDSRWIQHINQDQAELLHASLGIITESVEIVEELAKSIAQGIELSELSDNIKEEIGDLLWYIAIIQRKFNLSLDEIMEHNIAKLKTRYGEKYSDYAALNRADKEK